jgi:hypothetical protein
MSSSTPTLSDFAALRAKVYSHRFRPTLLVANLHGGIPSNPKVTEGWIRTKMADQSESLIRQAIIAALEARQVDPTAATPEDVDGAITDVVAERNLNGFGRMPGTGELFIEGRQVKAMLKEAVSIGIASGLLDNGKSWGKTKKMLKNFMVEHIFVEEERIGLGVTEPTGIDQRFIHTYRGAAIGLEEYVEEAKVSFTLASDYEWPHMFWPTVFAIGGANGLGAARSQGYGRFEVIGWETL